MFKQIQYKLLISYLLVLASVLAIFSIAVRVVFIRSLSQQLNDRLTSLGQAASSNAEAKQGHLQVEIDFDIKELLVRKQALQWFDKQGNLVTQQGKYTLNLPFNTSKNFQSAQIIAATFPIISSDDSQLIGYVRVSQSLEEFDETIRKLDLGLGGGVVIALLLSGLGGIFLTRQAMQPIETSFQRLKQFTADASHELRSPLMAIKSNVAVALKYPEGMRPSDAEKLQAIASATDQMTRLTEDLLLLERIDQSNHQHWDIVDLTYVLNEIILSCQAQATVRQVQLEWKKVDSLYLVGDPIQINRLFRNLLDNALKYTLAGGKVEIRANQINQWLILEVQDTGIGIAAKDLESIFERFWQADPSRSHHLGGSGLGLAIAQSIAKRHGGSIKVTSCLEVGTCFTVHLLAKK